MGLTEDKSCETVMVPAFVVVAAIRALEAGADAILDRDWVCYTPEERAETEWYADDAFMRVARELEACLPRQNSSTDASSDRSFRRS